jgi:phenylacetate-CoA ligase
MAGKPIIAFRTPYFSSDQLNRLKVDLLRSQIEYCAEYIPFYSRLFQKLGLSGKHVTSLEILHEIPTISKEDIRGNYDSFLRRGLQIDKLKKDHTSGSTGEPFWTYYDRSYWIRKKYFSKFRSRIFCGYRPGQKIAKLECEASRSLKQKHSKPWSPMRLIQARAFSMYDDVENVALAISAYRPNIIDGYPSFLCRLAQYFDSQKISLPGLKLIFTGSEYLSNAVRRYLTESFNIDVIDIYGCNEFKEVAWQCRVSKGYHINEDELVLEVLDSQYKPLGYEEAGQIVITDLLNRAMPLIRYRMADIGVQLHGKCTCGCNFAMMKPLAGRLYDDIILPNGKIISAYHFTTSIEKIPGLRQYQVVQKTPDTLVVKLNIDSHQKIKEDGMIETKIRNITNNLMNIDIQLCNCIEVEKNGKLRVIKNDLQGG